MSADPRRETLARTWTGRGIRFVFTAMLFCQAHRYAQLGPQPPCGKEPVPPYPGLNDSPTVTFWSESNLGRNWRPPASTSWAEAGLLRQTGLSSMLRKCQHHALFLCDA